MANSRNYSNTAVSTTLNGSLTNVATSVVLTAQTGMPTPPFLLCLEPDTANEELVLVNSGAGTGGSPYSVTRGQDGTTNIAHSSLVVAQHRIAAVDFTDSRTHEASAANVHGLNGALITVQGSTSGLTSNITFNNSASETTISKSFSIPGNSMVAGSMYRVTAVGTIACTGTPTLTMKLKYGSSIAATVAPVFSSAASSTFFVQGLFTCLVAGASGTLNGSLSFLSPGMNATYSGANSMPVSSTQLTATSTTSTQALLISATYSGTASASNVFTTFNTVVEQLF